VDAGGPGGPGHVRTVVHDEHPARPAHPGPDLQREGEGLAGRPRLGPELDPPDTRGEDRIDERDGIPSARGGRVDDDVEVEGRKIREAPRNAAQNSVSRNVVA